MVSQNIIPRILLLDLVIAMKNTPIPPNIMSNIGKKNFNQHTMITSWITAEMKKTQNFAPKLLIFPLESLTESL